MHSLLTLLLLATAASDSLFLEAESARLVGTEISTERQGYFGEGYVTGFDAPEDSVVFSATVDAGIYVLWARVSATGRFTPLTFNVDGAESTSYMLGTGAVFAYRKHAEQFLSAGMHRIAVTGTMDLDRLLLVRLRYAPPEPPASMLADSAATASARALYAFMRSVYGEKIIAGQQDLTEVQYIRQVTGREPAIGAFDLIDYSPSRVACGTRPGRSVENWIDWADQDGIVSLSWHWNAPTDLKDDDCNTSNNASGEEWWSGFYTRATTFDFAAALADTTSERYDLILRDIDAIAEQLKKFDRADVPVLWRPLHEAAGGWFWWGARGSEAYVKLWRLLYDRLVHHHGLHNLIWVYTHEPNAAAWYPGDDYVDIVSRDVYASSQAATMISDWDDLQTLYGDRKLIALSESGTLPDPEVVTAYGIYWNYMAVWSGSFIRNIDRDYLTRVFNSPLVITRDELPAWRSFVLSSESPTGAEALKIEIYPNPASSRATLLVALDTPLAENATVEMFDLLGRRVERFTIGPQPAGVLRLTVDVSALSSGVYLLRLQPGGRTASLVIAR